MATSLFNSLWNWHLKGKTDKVGNYFHHPSKNLYNSEPEVLLIRLWGNPFKSSTIRTKASIVRNILILRYHKEENKSDDIRKGGITSCKYKMTSVWSPLLVNGWRRILLCLGTKSLCLFWHFSLQVGPLSTSNLDVTWSNSSYSVKIKCFKVHDGIRIFGNSKMKSQVFCSNKLFYFEIDFLWPLARSDTYCLRFLK